jgi:hypothetical protein
MMSPKFGGNRHAPGTDVTDDGGEPHSKLRHRTHFDHDQEVLD